MTIRRIAHQVRIFGRRLAPIAAAASAALLIWHAAHDPTGSADMVPAPLVYPGAGPAAGTAAAATHGVPVAVQQAGLGSTIDVVVGRNDTLDRIFRRLALDTTDLAQIRELPGIRQSLDFLKPGDSIRLRHRAGEVNELTRKVSETQTLKVVRNGTGFEARLIEDPVETRIRVASATIDSSLFGAAESAGMSDTVALKLANVFAWDIDFVLDVRPGDRFTVVYQQIYQHGKYLRDGDVLAASFVNDGETYQAVRFVNADGVAGYYTPDGKPMRKAFLRAPLDFTRVSSAFNPHRMNPVLHRVLAHTGTDYAAPMGTPVHASGDGRVLFEGRKGGYGNAIILAHGHGITTLYGHLSRFARHLHDGERVAQGQVIGYVGMTGRATGPHLHYEYRVDGVYRNPQTVHLPGAPPLRGAELRAFLAAAAPLVADLRTEPGANAPRTAAIVVPARPGLGAAPTAPRR
ncbi:MAG: peptidoglycan DD-metalloendopeptidase family protein [Gammaproteobacteria bacterium]|nr:peptidoglycan DD-metalloendopeptidase family protein [Gammaproteobacteria bacterium]